ncbi:hypothetical protein GGR52DRAFT_382356 [Hypoxylon sp. FL1284]|nr:hypothetical protein GGR52DRAFT_382356 [Hypoxylon sp. FL1284]
MRSYSALALLGLASSAVATFSPQVLNNLRSLHEERFVVEVREVSPRADEDASACASSAMALVTEIPLPSDDLLSYLATATATDACDFSSHIPQSLSSEYSAYDKSASSWISQHTDELSEFATKCGDSGDVSSLNAAISSFTAGAGVCSSPTSGPAARATGFVAGAVAAAGFLGAAAAL